MTRSKCGLPAQLRRNRTWTWRRSRESSTLRWWTVASTVLAPNRCWVYLPSLSPPLAASYTGFIRLMDCPQVARLTSQAWYSWRFCFLFLVGLDRIIATIICYCQLFFLRKSYILVMQNVHNMHRCLLKMLCLWFAQIFRAIACSYACSYESVSLNRDRDAL